MPSSTDYAIPRVMWLIHSLQPKSVLDVGCGTGKYGMLIRFALEEDLAPEKWGELRIDGLDVQLPHRSHWHDLYNNLIIDEFSKSIERLDDYDVIYLGDIIEHFDKEAGLKVLASILPHARQGVIVTTPYHFFEQGAINGNEFERHKSWWTEADFHKFSHAYTWVEYRRKLIALVSNHPIAPLRWGDFGTRSWVTSALERSVFRVLGLNRARKLKQMLTHDSGNGES